MKRLSLVIFVMSLMYFSAPLTHAIEIAIPSDFPAYEFTDNDPGNVGYYFSSSVVESSGQTVTRPYTYIFDARGNLVWFFAEPSTIFNDNNVHYTNGKIILANRSTDRQFVDVILDENYVPVDTIDHANPFFDNMSLKWHGAQIMPDGSIYTVWDETRIVDMTPYGGVVDCEVRSNALQQWDADHNLLWTWSGLDHVDQLPFEAREDPDELLEESFGHMHLNSFQVLDDGDIICNGRTVNTVFRIDRSTGNLEWGLGGWGTPNEMDSFDFFTNLDLPADVGIEFYQGHDAHLYDNGTTLTFYDNGNNWADPYTQRSYAKTYELDYNNWTAELTWVHWHPDEFWAQITGSHRHIEDGKHLIGWGGGRGTSLNGRPTVNATEVDADGNTIWEMKFYPNPYPDGLLPKTYRWQKLDTFSPGAYPYLSRVLDPVAGSVELVCNWFGHEDEIDAYNVYMGLSEDNLNLIGDTNNGIYIFEDVVPIQPYYFQVEPVDIDGIPVGPMSNMLFVQWETSGLFLTPLVDTVPATGGQVVYAAHVLNAGPDLYTGLRFRTEVILPNLNTYGPLSNLQFNLFPFMEIEVSSLTLDVPAYAPEGDYDFIAHVIDAPDTLWTDSFGFTKAAPAGAVSYEFNEADWASGGEVSAFNETLSTVTANELPASYAMQAAYPNPFNPTTTLTVTLPEAANLTVVAYNVMGQQVAMISQGRIVAGTHNFVFDAANLASGLYFVRATVPGELNAVQKVMLVR